MPLGAEVDPAAAAVAAVGATRQRVVLVGILLLMLLACPLMHAFGHHGRSHRHGSPSEPDQR